MENCMITGGSEFQEIINDHGCFIKLSRAEIKLLFDGLLPFPLEKLLSRHIDYCFHCQMCVIDLLDQDKLKASVQIQLPAEQ